MSAARALAELAALQRDQDAATRRIGAALTAAVLDALDDVELERVLQIERVRADMESSTEFIDTALQNTRGVEKPLELGDTARRRSKKRPWGTFLMTLTRALGPDQVLELGTCLGVSSAYLATGLSLAGRGRLVTLEGAPALAERSRQNLKALGLDNVDVVSGLFAETLAPALDRTPGIGLAFIDGHHQEDPTLRYFKQIKAKLTDPAVVVFDDIRWSEGMERAWEAIVRDPDVRVAVDLESVGVCVVAVGGAATPRVRRLSTVTSLQAQVRSVVSNGAAPEFPVPDDRPARLNWGCGPRGAPGWINSDLKTGPGIDITVDIRDGLPLPDASMDYAVSIHALPMISLPDVVGVLGELRRVLKPGGTLRLSLPDLEGNVAAWQKGDTTRFQVGDSDAETPSGKFITQVLWFGYTVTLFTPEFAEELLRRAGFEVVHHCGFRKSASGVEDIVGLDDRESESFFVEAVK